MARVSRSARRLVRFPACRSPSSSASLLAFVTAFMSVLGFLLKHRGAVAAAAGRVAAAGREHDRAVPLADLRDRLRRGHDVVGLPRRRARARADLARAVGDRRRARARHRARRPRLRPRRQPARVDRRRADGAGLAFLAATLEGTGDSAHADYGAWTLAPLRRARDARPGSRSPRCAAPSGLALAVAAGMLWAGSDVTIKALSGKTGELGAGGRRAPVRARHPRALARRPARLRPLAAARPGGAGDRAHVSRRRTR